MQECDILFNTRFAFSTQSPVPQDRMDLESIALHELGHWLSLTDLYGDLDDGKVMYGFASYGEMKRSLSDGDKEGIGWIYRNGGPPSGPPATPTPLFPAGYVSTAYPAFSWSSVEGATSYVLYVSDSAQQGRINEEITASQANCSDGETTCSVTFHLPLRAGLATWMVKAKNALGESPWSAPLEFTIVGPDLAVGWDYGYQTCKYTSRGINCKVISGLHVSNLGNETSLPVSVDVYLWDGDYFYWMKTVKIPKIKGGGVKYKKIKFSYLCEGCSALQELDLVAEVDSGGFVSELDEENNLDLWGPLQ